VSARIAKSNVDYSLGMKAAHCGVCAHFLPPDACEEVMGKIDPRYWCKLFRLSRSRVSAHIEAILKMEKADG
jgi:hypothetical protein